MKKIRKVLLNSGAVLGWVFLLFIGGCGILPHMLYRHRDREIVRVTSPDGKHDAVVLFHYSPPYASGYESLCIVSAGSKYDDKQLVLSAHNLSFSKIDWASPRELRILHPAFESVLRYYPIWPSDYRFNLKAETIKIHLTVDLEMDSLEKWVEKNENCQPLSEPNASTQR